MNTYVDQHAPSALAASQRAAQLDAVVRGGPVDVLVIGGGITGVGAALDAASRGLRTLVVERDDWSCGTSSRSSKMIHGGLRYLASGDVAVVRESLREHARLQRNAAHLARPLPMLLPVFGPGRVPRQRAKLGAGMWVYEMLGHRRASGTLHRWLDAREVEELVPSVAVESAAAGGRLRGAYQYHDACADDSRLVMSVLRSAVGHGATAVNGTPALRLLLDGDRVCGAVLGGDAAAAASGARSGELEVEARVVVNAAGVWADQVVGDGAGFSMKPSKGIHLTVRRDAVGIQSAVAFFGQTDASNVFMEPWQHDLAFVGTTDTQFDGDLADPAAGDADIDSLLARINPFLRESLTREDVVSAWAGLRPLVVDERSARGETQDISRRHLLVERPGLVSIAGGKLTAYRAMAEMAIDAAANQLGVSERARTRDLRLDGWRTLPTAREVGNVAAELHVPVVDAAHLLRRHGSNAERVLDLVRADRDLGQRIHDDRPYLAAEVVWAREQEQARSADDVIERRTRIGIEAGDPGSARGAIEALLNEHGAS